MRNLAFHPTKREDRVKPTPPFLTCLNGMNISFV
jgi:hypothetical protein